MPIAIKNQGALEILDYRLEWGDELAAGETIATSTWVVDSALTQPNPASIATGNTATVVWLAGGIEGYAYEVFNRITTNQGRTFEAGFKLKIAKQFVVSQG